MKITDRLFKKVENIWQDYNNHPFVKGIANGSLEQEKFKFYMVQDYIYLLDYAKVFALGVVKSKNEKHMKMFANMINETINCETDTHKKYMSRLNLDIEKLSTAKPSITTTSYTNYMLSIAHNENIAEIAVAVLACSWSYKCIGDFMEKHSNYSDFYKDWIETYTSEGFRAGNDEIIDLVCELTQDYSESQIVNLEQILINCSIYEKMFWDMSYNMEM